MKKIIILVFAILLNFTGVYADLNIKKDSYGCLDDKNRASGIDMGVQNMTYKAMGDDWKNDGDGLPAAMLVVFCENMTEKEMEGLIIQGLSNGGNVTPIKEVVISDNLPSRRFFIPQSPKKAFDIDFAHSKLGKVRLHVDKMESRKTYFVTIQASGKTPIVIETMPTGAEIIFDGKRLNNMTNATIHDVTYGEHILELNYPLGSPGNSMAPTKISVSAQNNTFRYNLMKNKEVTIVATPENSEIFILNENEPDKSLAHGKGKITANLNYGTYIIEAYVNGEVVKSQLSINETTPSIKEINVIPSKTVTFKALQNNKEVDAIVDIDNVSIGSTPITYNLQYDEYYVRMSYAGYSRGKRIKVNKKSDSDYIFTIPTTKRFTWNPFEVDYQPYDIGVGFGYINRCYRWTEKGFSNSYTDFFGQSRRNHGGEIDILFQKMYKYGQGFRTGLNLLLTFGEIEVEDDYSSESQTYADMTMQIPIEYQFRLPISRYFSAFVHGGIGLNIGLLSEINLGEDEKINVGYSYHEDSGYILPRRFDCTWIIGGGLQFKQFQLEARFERGIANNAKQLEKYGDVDISGVTWRRQTWSIGLIYLFNS